MQRPQHLPREDVQFIQHRPTPLGVYVMHNLVLTPRRRVADVVFGRYSLDPQMNAVLEDKRPHLVHTHAQSHNPGTQYQGAGPRGLFDCGRMPSPSHAQWCARRLTTNKMHGRKGDRDVFIPLLSEYITTFRLCNSPANVEMARRIPMIS
jgi:hypothetical protein